ncbi:Glycoside hydrolase family 2 immunoglobulin-like beta-sandwich [Penicillium malachiteum]|uniref:Glycoside hydrolase family 2 immunoglobulin-like beta-sandwich n=1 Tax=Penicillium malachiteum TaxID=1324776 RepID=UPI002548238E|nr:Glycoside hydrolase family 2 immunoglobulin-like beta-sandwich [Penicillium malachiteum]KAJ5715543.1 Glycoside hydrolase family 2 immunoglobulin-like beta-sandwich [Penicillium malachiteum]
MYPHLPKLTLSLLAIYAVGSHADPGPLVSAAGEGAVIPGWNLQSATLIEDDMSKLSQPDANITSWHRVGPRDTVMGGLLHNGVYDDKALFYSNNMEKLADQSIFQAPWIYREEFIMNPSDGQYFTLKTHGITSKADIYLNGVQIASNEQQQGSYGGHKYDLTGIIKSGSNCLVIKAYPTNYLRDFAMGFVDWNPYPPDNGTGVWRNVEIFQTGPVSMSPFRVITDFTDPTVNVNVNVTLKTELVNHTPRTVHVEVNGTITGPIQADSSVIAGIFELNPSEKRTISIEASIRNPQIWWPAGWGEQPMYTVHASAMSRETQEDQLILSDSSIQDFGIRHVSSYLNEHNDTAFVVNGNPFQVLGAGYSPDMFMRFDKERILNIFGYILDLGLNTVRLEGKQEHPELYKLADYMGLMILTGWECCDKWEAWEYNHDADGVKWGEKDYEIARAAMLHEAEMMQAHPSLLGFLIGSDYWPNDQATEVFLDALQEMDWTNPVIASASKRGYPEALGPSGMKMNGPYDWVPPNYWYGDEEGAAFGFGSELGAGVGTPELSSLKKFMSGDDLVILLQEPDAGLYHMSNNGSSFYTRSIYNKGLFSRYGTPGSLDDYIDKCQMADYETTRAQFEAYSARQNASRPATGAIYWMLNSAWPNLHWQLFDYYLNTMGSYFGTRTGTRMEHVAYDYESQSIWLINHSLQNEGEREISVDLIHGNGKKISSAKFKTKTTPNSSREVHSVTGIEKIKDVGFLRLTLRDVKAKEDLSRNVYWLSPKPDVLDWSESNWYYTPVTDYADYTSLDDLPQVNVKGELKKPWPNTPIDGWYLLEVQLENESKEPAFFIHLKIIHSDDNSEIIPAYWSDNYVTLWPKEKLLLTVAYEGEVMHDIHVEVSGRNIKSLVLENLALEVFWHVWRGVKKLFSS